MNLFDDSELTYDDDDYDEYESVSPAAPPKSGASEKPLLAPRDTPELIGHADIEAQILSWWQAGRMPHTLILSGAKGIGKATLAFRLARFLLSQQAESAGGGLFASDPLPAPESLYVSPASQSFALVASGGHPDMSYVSRPWDERTSTFRDIIPVDDVRPVPGFLRKTASLGGWRVVIVDDADCLNNNAQNALLKILEEPPAKSMLILVTHNVGALIPTIRSRSRLLEMQPLNKDDFTTLVSRASSSLMQTDYDLLMDYANGAPGRAIELLEQGGIEAVRSVISLFETLPTMDDFHLFQTAESLSVKSNPDPLSSMLDVLEWQISSRATACAQNSDPQTMRRWLEVLDSLASHRAMCENGHLDRRHLAFGALKILQAALKT